LESPPLNSLLQAQIRQASINNAAEKMQIMRFKILSKILMVLKIGRKVTQKSANTQGITQKNFQKHKRRASKLNFC
jgi:hypothetical protein